MHTPKFSKVQDRIVLAAVAALVAARDPKCRRMASAAMKAVAASLAAGLVGLLVFGLAAYGFWALAARCAAQ